MTNHPFLKRFCLGAAMLVTGTFSATADGVEVCHDAWLLSYESDASVLEIEPAPVPGRKIREIALGEGLCGGDTVRLVKDGSAEIALAGEDESLILLKPEKDGKKEWKKIETKGSYTDEFRLLSELKDIFAIWAPRHYSVASDNFIMRGPEDPIDVAIMQTEVSKLVAGARTVALLWSGGQPPYRLSIKRDDEDVFATEAKQHALPTTSIDFDVGHYVLTISDAEGETLGRHIEVVAHAPTAPENLVAAIKNERFSAVVQSGWLSTLESGSWRWEAMLQILPYARTDPAAAGLTRALLNGDHPIALD